MRTSYSVLTGGLTNFAVCNLVKNYGIMYVVEKDGNL